MMPARWLTALGWAALAIAWFGALGYRPLYRADEARYAEIAREMVASGDWITPRLNGYKYFEKPPLQYWATAAAFEAAGANASTARLWTALTGFAGVLATALVAARLAGPAAGLCAAAILASSLLYVGLGHFSSLDMGVTLFLSAAVFAMALAQGDGAGPRARRAWMLAAWAAAAAAVLSKGLIGVVLPAAALTAYVVIQRDWALARRLEVIAGGAFFLALAAPWFVAVALANGEFARFFFVHEHFERFLTQVHGRYEPVWYFGPVLLWGLAPWTLAVLAALPAAWRDAPAQSFRPQRFLLVWVAVVLAFFSVSGSKLPSYILPALPALAVLGGAWLARTGDRLLGAQALLFGALGAAAAALAPTLTARQASADLPAALLAAYVPWLVAAGLALAAAGALAGALALRRRRLAAVAALACGGLAFGTLALTGHASLAPVYSAYDSLARIKSGIPDEAPFYFVETFDHSVPFYLGRTVTMVGYQDELATAIGWEPQRFIPTVAAFVERWRTDPRAFAMLSPREYATLAATGLPMTVLARDPRRVFVAKP